jgi:hypothetical protein
MSQRPPHTVKSKVMALPGGYRPPGSKAVRIAVSFDDEQFEMLNLYARNHGVSFGAAVRAFVDAATPSRSGTV